MAEKPILFNTEMVRAIMDGRKTQTRRVVKTKHRCASGFNVCFSKATGEITGVYDFDEDERMYDDPTQAPFQPGDVLYVRETWTEMPYGFAYRADGEEPDGWDSNDRWYPSIHMPKEAARLFLRVTGVRCERLQDMTEDEAICEGYDGMPWCYHHVFENYPDSPIPCDASSGYDCPPDRPCDKSIPELFGETIWNPTIKKSDLNCYGWEANPWVWVIEFERITL